MRYFPKGIGLALAAVALVACSVTYPVVGKFADHNEVFLGTVNHNMMKGEAFIEATGQVTGLKCRGFSRVVFIPTSNYIAGAFLIPYCAGQKGIAGFRCDDGRVVDADWTAESCSKGYGSGSDLRGARFDFAFGMTEQEALAKVAEYKGAAASKPALPGYRPREVRKERGVATGTGFFISADGYLIINHHVIDGSTNISVVIGGSEKSARLIRSDADHDLALLKVEGTFAPVPLGTSSRVARADEVFTLGYPMITIQGNAQKATFGRINALSGLSDNPNFLQMDVPIQPGNSGGPLFSREGNVIGVATMTLNQIVLMRESGTIAQNVNFAAKIELARPMLGGVQTRGAVGGGASLQALTQAYENSVVLVISR